MKTLHIILSLFVILSFIHIFPLTVNAQGLNWNLSYPTADGESTFIKISESSPNIIYASIRTSSTFDLLKSIDGGINWISLRVNLPIGQDVNWISTSLTDSNKVAISLWGSGIHLSEDGGSTWVKIFDNPTPRSVAISPTDSKIIFVGIGGYNDTFSGVYKTNNGGLLWNKLLALGNRNNSQISIDPNNSSRIFADADPNFYRTLDGGDSWVLLPLTYAYTTGTVFDRDNNLTLYTGYGSVFKSIDNGDSWYSSGLGFGGKPFHLSQDTTNSSLYLSNYNSVGGVWRSIDKANNWENVSDFSWFTANTWGLDVRNGRIAVGVEGKGIYIANTDATPIVTPPPPSPNPVVVIPGFGGSWSYNAFVLHQPTTYSNWELIPKYRNTIYDPLLNALKAAGLTDSGPNQNLFTFAYDYRKSITDTASWLNEFLNEQVLFKNPGKKVNIAAHSMGGLVARYCYEWISGCSDKIDKIVTGGTPNLGSASIYDFWEAGEISEQDIITKYAEKFLLHVMALPTWNRKEIVQTYIPGAKDLLPIYNYIVGRTYLDISFTPKNTVLESLESKPTYADKLINLSGNYFNTLSSFSTVSTTKGDENKGYWLDGKPDAQFMEGGDDTVLQTSAEVAGAAHFTFPIHHREYFGNSLSIGQTLSSFGLPIPVLNSAPELKSTLVAYATPGVNIISLANKDKKSVGLGHDQGKSVFAANVSRGNYILTIGGNIDTDFKISVILTDDSPSQGIADFKGTINKGEVKTFNFNL